MTNKTEVFIKKAREIYGLKYDYENTVYINTAKKVLITCKEHGDFEQSPNGHLRGHKNNCPVCKNSKTSKSFDTFLKRAEKFADKGFKYKNFKGLYKTVTVICPIHGETEQNSATHIASKNGCPACATVSMSNTADNFINSSNKIHKNKFNYSKVVYVNSHIKVIIGCKKHGDFEQSPCDHLAGKNGCKECYKVSVNNSKEGFIKKAVKKHGNIYEYENVDYINAIEKVAIKCSEHGIFMQSPSDHLKGCGCPTCGNSLLESKKLIIIDKFLSRYKVEKEKKFNNCRHIQLLRFDRYIPSLNLCIEYDGQQHFKATKLWGGESHLQITNIRDNIKNDFCIKNGINLLRIKYNQDPIEELKKAIMLAKQKSGSFLLMYGVLTESNQKIAA